VRSAVGGSFAEPLCLAAAALSSAVGEGVLGLLEEPATYRLYHCCRCGMQVCICAQCDCGNLYCPGDCAERARRDCVRRAGARYQRTPHGARRHAERQRRYRERQKREVTHHSFSLVRSRCSVSVHLAITASESIDVDAEEPPARAHRATDRLHYAAPSAARFFQLAAVRGVHLGSLTRGLIELLDTHGAAALEAALAAALAEDAVHLSAVRHFIDRHQAQRTASPPIPVTLPDDPRVRELAVRPHNLAEYEKLSQETCDDRSDAPPDTEPVKSDDNSGNGGGNDPVA